MDKSITEIRQVETVTNLDVNENQLSEAPVGPVDESKGDNNTNLMIAVIPSVTTLVLLVLIAGVVFYCIHRRNSQGIPPLTPTIDSAPLLPGQVLVQNGNGYGNNLYQHYLSTPSPVDGEERKIGNGHAVDGGISRIQAGGSLADNKATNLDNDRIQKALNKDTERRKESNNNIVKNNIREVNVCQGDEPGERIIDVDIETESLCGAVGGANDKTDQINASENFQNYSKGDRMKFGYGNVIIQNNTIKNMHIHMNGSKESKGKPGKQSDDDVDEQEESVSDTSTSTGLSASPTFALRNEQDRVNAVNDANETEVAEGDVAIHVDKNEEPPCRPELSFVPTPVANGCDECIADDKINKDKKEEKNPNGIRPFQQPATDKDRQVARVGPMRQNSEVTHMSGYPSDGINNDETNTERNDISMSYAFMHANSEYDRGYIGQDRDVANLNDVDDNVSSYGHIDVSGSILSCRQDQQNSAAGSVASFIRPLVVRGVGVTNSVQPMGLTGVDRTSFVQPMGVREAPEGRSINHGSDIDNPVYSDDMEQTFRKLAADEFDTDLTEEKKKMCIDTHSKLADSDDDLTEYKRKMKENQIDEVHKNAEERSVSEDSINSDKKVDSTVKYNVEDILYDDDTVTGDNSVSDKANECNEESFELESLEVRNMQAGNENLNKVSYVNCKEDDEVSESFEIRSEDIENLNNLNVGIYGESIKQSNASIGEGPSSKVNTEESFELDKCDIEQIVKEEEKMSRSLEDKVSFDGRTYSGESSFELDSADIQNANANDHRDINKTSDRKGD